MANRTLKMKRKLEQDNHEIEVVGHKVDFGSNHDFKKDKAVKIVAVIHPRQVIGRKMQQPINVIEENGNTVSLQDWNTNLVKLREKLKNSNKIEKILNERLAELETSISSTRSQLRGLLQMWAQFDEDGNIFRSRVYNKEYNHLANNSSVPQLPHILRTKATFVSKAEASKACVFEVLDGVQQYQDQLDQIYATLQSKYTQFPYLEAMIRDDILKIKLDKETFKKFRRAYKDCKAEHRLIRENAAISSTAEDADKLRDTIEQLEWDIYKLQRYDYKLDTLTINLQKNHQSMSVDVQNLQTLAKTPIEEGTVAKKVELDKDDPLLRELEDLQTSEEQAFAHLQKLRLEACNIQRDEILTSSQYRELENSVTVMEDFVSKQFLELEMLLSQSGTAQGHLLGLANLFERKELDKQSKDRHDILHKIDQISFTKQYLADWRQDLNLRQLEKEYFGPVQEEEENFAEILQTQHEGFHIYLDYTARKEERLLAERNKLLTVDKEMQQRIRHLTGNKACSPPRPGGSGKEVDTGGSHQPEELVRLKRELAKAQSERDSLKFQLDLFKNNALNQDTGNTSVQDSLKKTRNEIENFSKLIRKLKHITNLKGTESSLMREASDRAKGMQTLITSLEKCGHNFDELTMQRNKLADMISEADNRRLFQYSQNMIQDTKTGDKDAHLEIDKNSDMISINELNNLINTLPELDEKTSSLVQRISKYQEKLQNLHIVAAHENIENIRLLHTTAIPNVQIDCYQKALDKINGTLKERTNDIAAEERNQSNLLQQIRHARESIDQIRRQGRHHPPIDEVILEEIRTYKQDLMCPSCQNNYKDAIIPNCGHVFCHQCLKQVSECPKCKTSIEEGGICKLYLV